MEAVPKTPETFDDLQDDDLQGDDRQEVENIRSVGIIPARFDTAVAVFCCLLGIALISAGMVNSSYLVENVKLIHAFEADEGLIVRKSIENHNERNFDPKGFFDYPYLYPTVGLVVFRYVEKLGHNINPQYVAMTFRAMSLASAALCFVAMFWLARIFGLSLGMSSVAGLFLLTLPRFYYWSHMVHPDTLQVLLILVGFGIILRSHSLSAGLIASLFFGLAFSVKYAGLLVLPFALVPYAFKRLGELKSGDLLKTFASLIGYGVLTCILFFAVFAATNPYAAANAAQFVHGIVLMKGVVGGATTLTVPNAPFDWIWVVGRLTGFAAGPYLSVGAAIVIITMLLRVKGVSVKDWLADSDNINRLTLVLFVLYAFVVQYLFFEKQTIRYAFYFLPLLILLATVGVDDLKRTLRSFSPLLLIPLLGYMAFRGNEALAYMSFQSNKPFEPPMEVAEFVTSHYTPDTKIVYEVGAYVPPTFPDTRAAWGINQQTLDNLAPDVIIFNEGMSGRWVWKKSGTLFADRDFFINEGYGQQSRNVREFFLALTVNPDWKIVFERPLFVAFENISQIDSTKKK